MAYKGSGGKNIAVASLGQMVGLLLGLYVFDQVLDVIIPLVNTSAFFATAVSFIEDLLPVVGILGAFGIIYLSLRKLKMV